MNPRLFRRVGAALYGECWIEPIAEDLAVATRVVERWANGKREIPSIEMELAALCHEKARALSRMADMPTLAPREGLSAEAIADRAAMAQVIVSDRRQRAALLARLADELAAAPVDGG